MWWDSSDRARETRRSDVAFWLHLLAAPLIVHPIFSLLGLTDGDATIGEALVVLAVYVLLGITALAIDRRALLVSALAYVLFALISLFREFGAVELNIALAAFVIGSGLLLLSAFWHGVRRSVVRPLPPGLQARLPVLDRAVPVRRGLISSSPCEAWGGAPEGWWRGSWPSLHHHPSTTLRLLPLPIFDGEDFLFSALPLRACDGQRSAPETAAGSGRRCCTICPASARPTGTALPRSP